MADPTRPAVALTIRASSHSVNHSESDYDSQGEPQLEQLTIRGLGDDLARAIRRLANRDGTSLNRAAVKLLRRGAGLDRGQGRDTVGSSLDHLIGTWSDERAHEVEQALRHFQTIDGAMWE